MSRPKEVVFSAWLMAALQIQLPFLINQKRYDDARFTIGALSAMVTVYAVIYFYWRGRNWARWFVILLSACRLIALFWFHPQLQNLRGCMLLVVTTLGALLSLYLLYWLNTERAQGFFDPYTSFVETDEGA